MKRSIVSECLDSIDMTISSAIATSIVNRRALGHAASALSSRANPATNLRKFMIIFPANVVVAGVREVFDDVCGILAGICSGAQPTGHESDSLHRDIGGVDVVWGSAGRAALVADCGGAGSTLRDGLDFALLYRTQQAGQLRPSLVVLVGRPAHGVSHDYRPHG
jgi:hypothetical protein